ncbi:MAG: sporulation protein [Bacilli bacterium]|nr:sporulation protein [Bacilli bacterium]
MGERFISTLIIDFCVALGIVLGGSLVGAVGSTLTHHPPMTTMSRLAEQLRIWALVAALDGSVDFLRAFGDGVWGGQLLAVAKQFAYFTASFMGCQLGYYLIKWLVMGGEGV